MGRGDLCSVLTVVYSLLHLEDSDMGQLIEVALVTSYQGTCLENTEPPTRAMPAVPKEARQLFLFPHTFPRSRQQEQQEGR